MIILFDEDEMIFSGIGLGVLKDALSCTVSESLNDKYTLSMEYPVNGNNYSLIQLNRILYCQPNPYSSAQPFRIYSITKPIDGKVTIDAYHISYDMNDVAVGVINAVNIRDALEQIQNGVITENNFKLYTDITSTKKFKTTSPYNMRALLMGSDDSILERYDAEVRFDKWNAYITKRRGKNRGAQVRYAKNMTDLSHEINYDRLYNGVYPFYHKETTSVTSTTTTGDFKQVYIVGKKPYQDGWLSYSVGGEPYHPIDESPVQIATDGDWNGKVYCWDSTTKRYVEKIYNQTVTLVEGVTAPKWIIIDWGTLPNITCKANADGYFKTATDTTWTYHKAGEVIFQEKLTNISNLSTKIIIYYSEVVPSSSSSSSDENTSVTHVELKDKIIWLDTPEAKAMKHNRILMLDLSSEFGDNADKDDDDEDISENKVNASTMTDSNSTTSTATSDNDSVPTEEQLRAKAEKYIKKNKIGTIKFETSLSFIDFASTTEKDKYKDFEKIELGDTVKVVYDALGINIDLRVITTEYNVLTGIYDKIELGEKSDTLSASSVQNGDNISSLTNDSDYATSSTVNKLIAKVVTADYILAKNAKLTTAQITELQTARIKCTGILEASQLELDQLVAKMITADNAAIANELSAGRVKVSGDITINSGAISIKGGQAEFLVDRDGNVTANSVSITGGNLNINDNFEVTNDGILTARGADIQGIIQANEGNIGGFTIGENAIYHTIPSFNDTSSTGVYLGTDGIKLGENFQVDSKGNITAKAGVIGGASIVDGKLQIDSANIQNLNINNKFIVKPDGSTTIQNGLSGENEAHIKLDAITGKISISNADVAGTITAKTGKISEFTIEGPSMYNGGIRDWLTKYPETESGIFLGIEGIRIGPSFKITADGATFVGDEASNVHVGITKDGKLTAKSATIIGNITAESGYIGTKDDGFIINSKSISKGFGVGAGNDYTNNPGSDVVYIGTDAIRLGKNLTFSLSEKTSYIDYATPFKITLPNGAKNLSRQRAKLTYSKPDSTITLTATYKKANGYIVNTFEIRIDPAYHPTSHEFFLRAYDDDSNYLELVVKSGTTGKLSNVEFSVGPFSGFVVTKDGLLTATNAQILGTFQGNVSITGGSLSIGNDFKVSNDGEVTANNINITGGSLLIGDNFAVDNTGKLTANDVAITGGMLSISDKFKVTNTGVLTATAGTIGGFNILSTSLSTTTKVDNFAPDNLILQNDGTVVGKKVIFNTYKTDLTGGYFRTSNSHLSYRAYYDATNTSTDYLFPWGVVTAYNDVPNFTSQSIMPFDSVISLSPKMRGVTHTIKYVDALTGTNITRTTDAYKHIGKHLGLYIWNYDGDIAQDDYKEMTAAEMGFNNSAYLFAVVSQKNLCNLSNENHSNKLSTCIVRNSKAQMAVRVYNDGGTASDGFVCFVIGIIDDDESTTNLYLSSGGALSNYAGHGTAAGSHEYPFSNDNLYYH